MAYRPKSNIRIFLRFFAPLMLLLLTWACATIVSPTGGPKDVTPPDMVSSVPKNLSTNFKGNKLVFTFDEYIQLKTPEKFILISPPLSKQPDIAIKGRSVIVKIEDSLHSNTTYSFYLGEAIVDLSENNPVPNFNFAFSTGPDIDSLSLSGNVTDAFTRMPVKGALVMLYNDFTDSVPKKQIPMYVSRTLENGSFNLNSLASGKYRAIALVDGNSDYMYNLPTELIGFSSDSVTPYHKVVAEYKDTTEIITDAAKQLMVSIDLFPEPDSLQRILKSVIAANNRLSVAFRYPMKSPVFKPLNIPDSLPWAKLEWNQYADTLNAWLLNKPDTLKLEISEMGTVLDTLTISTTVKTTGKAKKGELNTHLRYSSSATNGVFEYGEPFIITFTNPVEKYDLSLLTLTAFTATDTINNTPVGEFVDSIQRHLQITYNWNSSEDYDLYFPKGSFTDIYSDSCDSTHVYFQMRPIEEYGRFAVTINRKAEIFPIIIQLISEKGLMLEQRSITTEKRVDFGLLPPAKYGLKAIFDRNGNGRWDTGEFIKKIQPERVLVHPKIFEVRTNWELEETWDL